MNTNIATARIETRGLQQARTGLAGTQLIAPLGRALFGAIFISALIGHFSSEAIGYAAQAGVPLPNLVVPLSGVLAFAGGVSVLVGYRAKIGAWLLVFFLIPVTLMMHNFWAMADPMAAQMHQAMFMKNVALLGAALLITQLGAGPMSLEAGRERSKAPVSR